MASDKNASSLNDQHLEWLIESRAKNQKETLRLLKIIRAHPKVVKRTDQESSIKAQSLASVAFSLWRAAFLSDRDMRGLDHADAFLERLITDNAIGYSQDRNSRNWTGPYYLNNAYFQLRQLMDEYWEKIPLPEPGAKMPRETWDKLHLAFAKAIDFFEEELNRE